MMVRETETMSHETGVKNKRKKARQRSRKTSRENHVEESSVCFTGPEPGRRYTNTGSTRERWEETDLKAGGPVYFMTETLEKVV